MNFLRWLRRLINRRPLELVFVRHGESTGNEATHAAENGDDSLYTDEFKGQHSSKWELTAKGAEQAKAAGLWIRQNINQGLFDGYYTSTYTRAFRTAGYLNLPGALWSQKDYLREHDWGHLDAMTDQQRWLEYPRDMKRKEINPFYFSPTGGESMATVIIRGARTGIIPTLYREFPGQTAIIVSHGNLIWGIRTVIESLLPNEYMQLREDKTPGNKINNCQVIQYTRKNPFTGQIAENFNWMRSVCPWKLNPETDVWRTIVRRKYTNQELLEM